MLHPNQLVSRLLILVCGLVISTTAIAQEKAKTPLGEFFRQLDRGIRNEAEELELIQKSRDQMDIRVPQSAELHRRFQQLRSAIKNEEWHQAIELFHILQQQPEDLFLMDVERNLTSLRDALDTELLLLPEDGVRGYLNRFEAVSKEEYDHAVRGNDVDEMRKVARLFLLTSSGQQAAVELMWSAVDRGDFRVAANWSKRLSRFTKSGALKEKYHLQTIEFLISAGEHTQANELIEEWKLTGLTEEQLATLQTPEVAVPVPSNAITPYTGSEDATWFSGDLLQVWMVEQIARYSVRSQVEELVSTLSSSSNARVLLPSALPLIVGDELILKTLSGVTIRDLETGALRWNQAIDGDLEARLTPTPFENSLQNLSGSLDEKISPYQEDMEDDHSLVSLLFRDNVRTRLTSDGKRLFMIQENRVPTEDSMGYRWQWRNDDGETDELKVNELTAIELDSRRTLWTLGGDLIEKAFSRRLAGTYFFGAPVAHGERLYVIGEQDEAVRLFVIEAATGDVIFSQTLSYSGRPVNEDTVRRRWDCSPLIVDGLAICPTTTGWLTAVNLETQRLAWSTRYTKRSLARGRRSGNGAVHSTQSLNTRWQYSSLLVSGSSILFTPPELPDAQQQAAASIICFDKTTGIERWRLPKNNMLYLQGIDENRAIFVEKGFVKAININQKGKVIWQKKSPAPTGRGVIVNHQLVLPVTGGKLLKYNLADGALVQEYYVPGAESLVGNLTLHNGTLYATSPLSLIALKPVEGAADRFPVAVNELEQRVDLILAEADDAVDAYQLIHQFRELHAKKTLPAADRLRLDEAEWNVLTLLARTALLSEKQAERISELAKTEEQKAIANVIRTDRIIKKEGLSTSVDALLELLFSTNTSLMVDDGTRRVRVDVWVSSRLQQLHTEAKADVRADIDVRLEALVQEHMDDPTVLKTLSRALTFHPAKKEIELELGQRALKEGQLTTALIRFQRAARSDQANVRQAAWIAIGRACFEQELFADAQVAFDALISDCEDFPPTEMNLIAEAKSARNECAEQIALVNQGTKIPEKWEVNRRGSFESNHNPLLSIYGDASHHLRSLRSSMDSENQVLHLRDIHTGQLTWSMSIRGNDYYSGSQTWGLRAVGPKLFVNQKGLLLALDVHEKQVSWMRSFDVKMKRNNFSMYRSRNERAGSVLPGPRFVPKSHSTKFAQFTGDLLAANQDAVVLKRNTLEVMDPLSGETLWIENEVPTQVAVKIVGEVMLLVNGSKTTVRNIHSGAVVSFPLLEEHGSRLVSINSNQFVTTRINSADNGAVFIQSTSLKTGEKRWEHRCDSDTLFSPIHSSQLTWVTPERKLQKLNLETGSLTDFGELPEVDQLRYRSITIVHDDDLIYVNIPETDPRETHLSLNSILVSGILRAYRPSGKLMWSRDIADFVASTNTFKADELDAEQDEKKDQSTDDEEGTPPALNLLTDDLRLSPLLVLAWDQPNHLSDQYYRQLAVICLDKRTGKVAAEWNQVSTSGSFRSLEFDLRDHSLLLQLYESRIKISPVADEEDQ